MNTSAHELSGVATPPVGRPLATGLAIVAGLLRLVPPLWNFTPVGGLSVFSGARLRSWHAFALPIAVMFVTDIVLWRTIHANYPLFHYAKPFVYGSLLVNVLLGRLLMRTESPWRIGGVTLLASIQFFLVTNFGSWLYNSSLSVGDRLYTPDAAGLVACYVAGLPFFGGTLLGDLFYTGTLFGLHAWLSRAFFPGERVAVARRTMS